MFIFNNPLRFDSTGDFGAATSVEEDISAAVRMVLLTRGPLGPIQGEVPWDPDAGCALDYYRHSRENVETTEIDGIVTEALKQGLPDAQISSITVVVLAKKLIVTVRHGKAMKTEVAVPFA